MPDFTISTYQKYIQSLKKEGFSFILLEKYAGNIKSKCVLLRHDVDLMALNSLETAEIEYQLDIKGIYYFRIVKQSNRPEIIEKIASLGHEIGYHYEDLVLCKGNMDKAIKSFEKNLRYFRQFYPVKTICMHGSPLSKYDNRKLWEKYDYRDCGIVAEPYFDVDYTKVLYLTDTGRRWDGERVSVRDKVRNSREYGVGSREKELEKGKTARLQDCKTGQTDLWRGDQWDNGPLDKKKKMVSRNESGILIHNFHSTFDLIKAAERNRLPDQIMITVHPQRWTNNPILWTKEFVIQNVKNQMKRVVVKSTWKSN